ncbi:MAG: hypothetical protein AB7V45_11720 [Candidatus Krumholzibacteriia bacterium]
MFRTATTCVLILLWAVGAGASQPSGVPDLVLSTASCANPTPQTPTVMVAPDGGGAPFDQALLPDGTVVDATITLELKDGGGFPIFMYPFEDLWLESADGGLSPCLGGSIADANTDQNGETEWRNPLHAGGYSEAVCLVMVSGSSLIGSDLALAFNSPDINGDGRVDLSDVGLLASDYHGGFAFRCDFYRNGRLDLADVGMFARSYGTTCP